MWAIQFISISVSDRPDAVAFSVIAGEAGAIAVNLLLWLVVQVYWVYDILKQPRVIATDRDENYISIPLDYKQRFHIIEKGQSNK